MADHSEQEALDTYRRFVAQRDEIDRGRGRWGDLAEFFVEDAAYIDPAWGRVEGREGIRHFLEESMAGLTGHGWSTPQNWVSVDGPRLLSQWDQVIRGASGDEHRVPGLSILYYAGDGQFCYSHDMLNMTHVGEVLKAVRWKPPGEFNFPPRDPNRDTALPERWAHLAKHGSWERGA